jgi:hypothetical protein
MIVQQLNESLFYVLGHVHTERPIGIFPTQKGLPAIMITMEITTPAGSSTIHHQLPSFANDDADEPFLIVPTSATQTRSLWTMSMAGR